MENVRIVGRGEHECPGCFAVVDGFKNALQLQAIGTDIGSDHAVVADKRLERFAVRLRQFAQADRFAGECFEWGKRLFKPLGQSSGGSKSVGDTNLRGSLRCSSSRVALKVASACITPAEPVVAADRAKRRTQGRLSHGRVHWVWRQAAAANA